MAFAEYGFWVAVVRLPSDDFKLKQVIRLNGIADREHAERVLRYEHTNPDVKIEELYPVASNDEVIEVTAKVIAANGVAHRSPRANEVHLTIAQVAKLKGRPIDGPAPLALPPEDRAARAASDARIADGA